MIQSLDKSNAVATVLTVYGIETFQHLSAELDTRMLVATVLTVYGIETCLYHMLPHHINLLQQHLSFTICATGCEVAEAQSDDEAHTLQVPERSEGKTKVIKE